MKKLLIGIISLFFFTGIASAQMSNPGISYPNYLKKSGSGLLPVSSSYTLGTSGTPWAFGYFDELSVTTTTATYIEVDSETYQVKGITLKGTIAILARLKYLKSNGKRRQSSLESEKPQKLTKPNDNNADDSQDPSCSNNNNNELALV